MSTGEAAPPDEGEVAFKRRDASTEMQLAIAKRVVALAIILALIYYIATDRGLSDNLRLVLGIITPPIAVGTILIVVGMLLRVIFKGYMVEAAETSVMIVALTLILAMLAERYAHATGGGDALYAIAILTLVVGFMVATYIPVKSWTEHGGKILSGILLLILSLVTLVVLSGIVPDILLAMVSIVLAIVGILQLVSMLAYHQSDEVKKTGKFLRGTSFKALFALCVLSVAYYVFLVVPHVSRNYPERVMLAHWIMVCIVLAICGLILLLYLKDKNLDSEPEKWGKSINNILSLDPDLVAASGAIDEFIDGGKKEKLVIAMTFILQTNGVTENAAERIVGDIIRHRDREEPMVFILKYLDFQEEAKSERKRKVLKMLKSAASEMHMTGSSPNTGGT